MNKQIHFSLLRNGYNTGAVTTSIVLTSRFENRIKASKYFNHLSAYIVMFMHSQLKQLLILACINLFIFFFQSIDFPTSEKWLPLANDFLEPFLLARDVVPAPALSAAVVAIGAGAPPELEAGTAQVRLATNPAGEAAPIEKYLS